MKKIIHRKMACLGPCLIAVALLVTYAPLVRAEYAFGDDFVLFLSETSQEHAFLADGRPIFALAQWAVHRPIDRVEQLGWIRLSCVIGFAACATVFWYRLARIVPGRIARTALVIALFLLPCIQTYAAMAMTWLSPWSGLAAMTAAIITMNAFRRRDHHQAWIPSIVLATGLMFVTAMTYQPMLSWYWTVILVALLDLRFLCDSDRRRRLLGSVGMGLFYFAACFVAFKLFFLVSDFGPKDRTALINNPIEKAYEFLRIQLPQAFSFWKLMRVPSSLSSLLPALFGVLFVAAAIGFRLFRDRRRTAPIARVTWVASLAVVFLLTHVHWWVIADVPQSYRVIAPMGVAALILMAWSLTQFTQKLSRRSRKFIRSSAMVAVGIFAIVTAQAYNQDYWIRPHENARRFLTDQLRQNIRPDTQRIVVIRQGQYDGWVRESLIECFGRPAFERSWTITDMIRNGLKESGVRHQVRTIENYAGDEPFTKNDQTVVLDMRVIGESRPAS